MSSKLSEEGLLGLEAKELLKLWEGTINSEDREPIVEALKKKGLFPKEYMKQWDQSIGAYPDYNDPDFLQRLLAKKEFAESFQSTWDPENDPCAADTKFEITPVQRFAANLMSPRTPYMSALLYHGVGVGKTCSAIQISEAWLEEYPQEQVFIIAPPTIRSGFITTIFDTTERRLKIGTGIDPNKAFGCTGDTYLELTGTVLERDVKRINLRVKRAIDSRYRFFGYIEFANYVKRLVSRYAKVADIVKRESLERQEIRTHFENKLLIVDEAHNLREISPTTKKSQEEENADEPGGKDGVDDMTAGKFMTPWLLKVLDYSYGMKLVLMTATPMYNSHLEIIFLLNLLLRNDKKGLITQDMVFNRAGDLKEGADRLLGSFASRYISFMRGENPRSFPIRLKPQLSKENTLTMKEYPELTMKDRVIPENEKKYIEYLPIVKIPLPIDSENYNASIALLKEITTNVNLDSNERGISSQELGISVQAGNFVPPPLTPSETEPTAREYTERIRKGLIGVFDKEIKPRISYKAKAETNAKWLLKKNLIKYSPKFVYLLEKLTNCEGVVFVYSRFIESGALPLALALEANGYRCYNRDSGFLADGIQDELGGQCALCPRREVDHSKGWVGIDGHDFRQAYYGLLTGEKTLTPDRDDIIKGEQAITNVNGAELKIIIGSQIASEGVDLRYVREVHILDSWYHLNKTEQVIGRAIRFCSHSALEKKKRNTTIYLYASYYPDVDNETADLYSYRLAFRKAKQVGQVSRSLKAYAIDCNLNHDAIIIRGQDPVYQTDSQRVGRPKVNINDVGFTAICDWIENCDYECKPKRISYKEMGTDDSTYNEYAVRWRMAELRERMRAIFETSVFIELADMEALFSDIPVIARTEFLTSIIDNTMFEVVHKDVRGYIKFCNNYFVFQPLVYGDLNIPLAIRMGSFPVRKDFFDPDVLARQNIALTEEEATTVTTDMDSLWSTVQEWATALSKSKTWIEEPKQLIDHVMSLAQGDLKMITYLTMVLSMIHWVYNRVISGTINSEAFQRTIEEFVWDNWLTLPEQKRLHDEDMLRDSAYREDDRTVFRFYNPYKDTILYEINGTEASEAVQKIIHEKETADLKEFRAREDGNRFYTGSPYGFLIGKKGKIVFKTNTIPIKGRDWDRGRECGNVTNSDYKYVFLEILGNQLREKGAPDLELTRTNVKSLLAAQCCIVLELVLRYMDASKFDGKRWFYRPVLARILGHLGSTSAYQNEVISEPKVGKTVKVIKTEESAPVTIETVPETIKSVPNTTIKKSTVVVPTTRVIKKKVIVTKEGSEEKVDEEKADEEKADEEKAVPKVLSISELKALTKEEIDKLSNDEIPPMKRVEFARIYAAAK